MPALMNNRRLIIIGASVLVALVAALIAVWWFALRSNAPPAVSLDEAVAAATSSTQVATTDGSAVDPAGEETATLDGTWEVIAGNGSFAGYRVREELARIGFTTAAGRSTDLGATLVIEGDAVTTVDAIVNMQRLESDENRRDNSIRTQALETDAFPTGSFRLTEPIELPGNATSGEPFSLVAVGDLEIHGVANQVELPLEAQFVDGVIAVIGTAPVLFSDYEIDPPTAPILLSVDDNGEMEFQLLFEK